MARLLFQRPAGGCRLFIGGTELVANLRVGGGAGKIGLRAYMDALNITESAPGRIHASCTLGKMHACGYDGHMSMVLGAAKLLAERRNFNGTVRFIFQPAEEHGRGVKAMMKDGLFERFPVDAIFGAHNMPGMPAGSFATRPGGIMASEDNFVIRIKARGTHAARPHMGVDPIVIAIADRACAAGDRFSQPRPESARRDLVHGIHH